MNNITRLSNHKVNKFTKEYKHEVYKRALSKLSNKIIAGEKVASDAQGTIVKAVYLGMHYINTMPKELNSENLTYLEEVMNTARNMLKLLTFETFKKNFPIEKRYAKLDLDWKDYYYTVDAFKEWNENEIIGEKIDDLLWDYQNEILFKFHVNSTLIMSAKLRLQGKKGIGEMFAEHFQIPTYTQNQDGSFTEHWAKPNLTLIKK